MSCSRIKMKSKELENILKAYQPYTNAELLQLFCILVGKKLCDISGWKWNISVGGVPVHKDDNDIVKIDFPYIPAHAWALKKDLFCINEANQLYIGIFSQFKHIPLYINEPGRIIHKMVNWRLRIGR